MTQQPGLYDPIRIGPKTAKNRVMRVATTANLADNNRPGPRLLAFYRTVAKGGTGTIVTEALRMQREEPIGPAGLVIYDRDCISALRQLSDLCHAEGTLLIGQLVMGGRQHLASRVMPFITAPSAIACPRSGGVPHELSDLEIEDVIEAFVACAVHCIEAGMDGVEIHGAQGHLIQQFLSPYTNRREDDWGGTAEKRMRFPKEILTAVRRRIGPRAIIGYRMGVEEFTEGGLTVEDNLKVAEHFCAEGLVDYLSLAQGNFNSIETHLPDRHLPILGYRSLHAPFKAVANGVPVIATTRVQHPDQAEDMIQAGEADMVGLCRALLVDPDWTRKGQAGQGDQIRRCIACNQCWGWISGGEPITCATNPMAGREHLWPPLHRDRAEAARRVTIVGAGPAGLEAARVAAARGHDVTVLERSAGPGGRLSRIHEVPYFQEMGHLMDFLVPQVRTSGADIRFGVEADAEALAADDPDEIIIATGATPHAAELPSDGSVPVLTTDGQIDRDLDGRDVVIMDEDGYYWTSAVTEAVIAAGGRPLVVSRVFEVCREIPMVSRIEYLRQLDKAGGEPLPNHLIAEIRDGGVVLHQYQTGRETVLPDVAAVYWIGAAIPNSGLATDLRRAGFPKHRIHLVGDAFAPRRLTHALTEAHAAARKIGSPARH